MKQPKPTPTAAPEILYIDSTGFESTNGQAQNICRKVNEALTMFYNNLNQPRLSDLTIIQNLITGIGNSEATFAALIRRNQQLKHPQTDESLGKIIVDSLLKTSEYKAFIRLIDGISHFNKPLMQYGTPPIEYYKFDADGYLFFDSDRAKVEKFTSFIDSTGKRTFVKIADSIAANINTLFEMQLQAGDFGYRTNVGEYFDRISEMLIIEEGKVIFNRSYLHSSTL